MLSRSGYIIQHPYSVKISWWLDTVPGLIYIGIMFKSIEKIWARATGHLMGNTDDDKPDVPILSLKEARIALFLKTFWIIIHIITCFFIIINVIRHW
jgi:hypothetical protein